MYGLLLKLAKQCVSILPFVLLHVKSSLKKVAYLLFICQFKTKAKSSLSTLLLLLLIHCTAYAWTANYGTSYPANSAVELDVDPTFHLLYGGNSTSLYGDFTATGDSILNVPDTYTGLLASANSGYMSVDATFNTHADTRKRNSSSATLNLPSYVEGSHIVFAGLFWQGMVHENIGAGLTTAQVNARVAGWNEVTFKTPDGTKHNLAASLTTKDLQSKTYHYAYKDDNSFHFNYGAYVNVTDLVKNTYSSTTNAFTTGNILTTAGADWGDSMYFSKEPNVNGLWINSGVRMGYFGGWSLIVVYDMGADAVKDHPEIQFKNISLYDGYDQFAIWANPDPLLVNVTLNSFLTPSKGTLDSKLLIFGGAGDYGIRGDVLKLYNANSGVLETISNTLNPDGTNNTLVGGQFNSSYTNLGVAMSTKRIRNGVDLDIFDVSNKMAHQQSTTQIQFGVQQMGSQADQIFPQVLGFSTRLYEPRVCYFIDRIHDDDNKTVFENRQFVAPIEDGKNYNFDMWISNMKRSVTDTDIETARLVQVYLDLSDMDYKEESTYIQNLGTFTKSYMTDSINSDLAEFDQDNNRSTFRVGIGASGVQGGDLEPALNFSDNSKKAFVTLSSKFLQEANATSINLLDHLSFKASFQTDSITIGPTNAQRIEQCIDLNTTAEVSRPPIGAFNVVNETFSNASTTMNNDFEDASNALYTQVSGQNFNVKILSLGTDNGTNTNITAPYDGNITVSMIEKPDYSTCGNTDNTCKQLLCDNTTSIANILNGSTSELVNMGTNAIFEKTFNLTKAHQNLAFKIRYKNNLNEIKYSCSLDNFAVKPASYVFDFTNPPLRGRKPLNLSANAKNNDLSTTTQGYTHATTDANLSAQLVKPFTCTAPLDTNKTTISIGFTNGVNNSAILTTNNIGDYNISIEDNRWTFRDTNKTYGQDCDLANPYSTVHNATTKKVGCSIVGNNIFFIAPKEFQNTLQIQNFGGNAFTYLSGDANMSATATLNTVAIMEDNTTATNYTANCFADDINYTISFIENNVTGWLNNSSNALNRIRYSEDGVTSDFNTSSTGSSMFRSSEGNFTNGVANLTMLFNFTRDSNRTDEPFIISKNDFNISIQDTNGTTGNDFNRLTDQNTTFYYGRVHAPDYRFSGANGNATIYYEVYCKDCNRTALNMNTWNESVNAIHWYRNPLHVDTTFGSYYNSMPATAITGVTIGGMNVDTMPLTLTVPSPHVNRITFGSNEWLRHYPEYFTVEFYSTGSWAGAGFVKENQPNATDTNTTVGEHIHKSAPTKAHKRLNW